MLWFLFTIFWFIWNLFWCYWEVVILFSNFQFSQHHLFYKSPFLTLTRNFTLLSQHNTITNPISFRPQSHCSFWSTTFHPKIWVMPEVIFNFYAIRSYRAWSKVSDHLTVLLVPNYCLFPWHLSLDFTGTTGKTAPSSAPWWLLSMVAYLRNSEGTGMVQRAWVQSHKTGFPHFS